MLYPQSAYHSQKWATYLKGFFSSWTVVQMIGNVQMSLVDLQAVE